MSDFKLRRPCPKCPFREDVPAYLRRDRAEEIARALANGAEFACHETTVTDPEDESENIAVVGSQFCAGALIVMEKSEAPNQQMRVAERLGLYDPSKLDMDAPTVRSLDAFIAHHGEDEEEPETCSAVEVGCLAPAGWLEDGHVISNRDADPDNLTRCPTCGEAVCLNCAVEVGPTSYCPVCAEYEDQAVSVAGKAER